MNHTRDSHIESRLRRAMGEYRKLLASKGFKFEPDFLAVVEHSIIVGQYMRYDQKVRDSLKDFQRRITAVFYDSSPHNSFLLWGPPGAGKTYLVQQIAKSIEGTRYQEFNLAVSDKSSFKSSLSQLESEERNTICLIDEVDANPNEVWPYEILLKHLAPKKRGRASICFILAGSSGWSLSELVQKIRSRPAGAELLNRIPQTNRISVPPLSVGDKIVLAAALLQEASSDEGRTIRMIEELALYYLAVSPKFDSIRRLRAFAVSLVRRIPIDKNVITYDDLFETGDTERKEFWQEARRMHPELSNSFVRLDKRANQLSNELAGKD